MAPLLLGVTAGALSSQEPPRKLDAATDVLDTHLRSADRCMASRLIGCELTNSKDEGVGQIHDIVLDSGNQRIAYAVVSFGGFLGMGEKYFAMPWRIIEVTQRSAADKPRITLDLDPATLKAAPGFDTDNWPDMANPTWAKQVDEYYRTRGETVLPEDAPEAKGSDTAGKAHADQEPNSANFAHRRLSRIIGTDVVDPLYSKLADVEDLVVDTKRATIDATLLSFGGTLGIGEHLALVPFEALTLDSRKNVLVLPCTQAQLEAMALPNGKLPALNDGAWLTRSRAACAAARATGLNADGDVIAVDASGTTPVPFADSYDLKSVESVKGTITTIGTVRVGDLNEERVRLRVRTADGRDVTVYAAPESFEAQRALAMRSGTAIKITGSPTKYRQQDRARRRHPRRRREDRHPSRRPGSRDLDEPLIGRLRPRGQFSGSHRRGARATRDSRG